MTDSICREWLEYAFKTIVDCNDCPPPSSTLPADDLQQLGADSMVYWALEHNGESLSPEQSTQLLSQRLMNALKRRELDDICSSFDENGVNYRLLKGQCMWLHLYSGREEIRPVSDSDILVQPENYERAVESLETLGYRSDSTTKERLTYKTTNQFTFSQWFGQFGNSIDLHRFAHNWPLHHRLSELAMQPLHLSKFPPFTTLNKPSAFVWIACHRAKDRFKGDLREVLDAKFLLHSMSHAEMVETFELIQTLKLEKFSMLLILQAQRWFGKPFTSSQESGLLSFLTQAQPRQANQARKRIASDTSVKAANSSALVVPRTRQVLLFNQYLESLQAPGLRMDALLSMFHYAFAKCR